MNILAKIRQKIGPKAIFLVQLVLSLLFVVFTILYTGKHANHVYLNIQDALVYPYFFKNFRLHDIILPAQHANILKFPLFWLQSILPYNRISVTAVNITLLFVSIVGWALIAGKLFGKKYLPLSLSVLGTILLGSTSLGLNMIETTIRNIEYPIGLLFVLAATRSASHSANKWGVKYYLLISLIAVLFALALAGDSFMLYGFGIPLLITITFYTIVNQQSKLKVLPWNLAYAVIGIAMGYLIRYAISWSGIAIYATDSSLGTSTLPLSSFAPSLAHTFAQILDLTGADIFSKPISIKSSLYFINFLILLTGIAGLFSILKNAYANRAIKTDRRALAQNLALSTVSISFIITVLAYIFSNLVVVPLPNGVYADASNIRYITLLPFIVVVGVVYLAKGFIRPNNVSWAISSGIALALAACFASYPSVSASRAGWDTYATGAHSDIADIISTLNGHHTTHIVVGDSLGAPIRFWSNDTIQYSSLAGCNQYMSHNTRLSWRKPVGGFFNNALVIDRLGLDRPFLSGCTDETFRQIYGTPHQVVLLPSHSSEPIQIWFYTTDIRGKL